MSLGPLGEASDSKKFRKRPGSDSPVDQPLMEQPTLWVPSPGSKMKRSKFQWDDGEHSLKEWF